MLAARHFWLLLVAKVTSEEEKRNILLISGDERKVRLLHEILKHIQYGSILGIEVRCRGEARSSSRLFSETLAEEILGYHL